MANINGAAIDLGGKAQEPQRTQGARPASALNWAAIDADPKFQALHRQKSRFLWTLMIISVAYYFLLPVGAAYFPGLFRVKVWGPVNIGIVFALSEFVVAWAIAYVYARSASRRFDPMAEDIASRASAIGGAK